MDPRLLAEGITRHLARLALVHHRKDPLQGYAWRAQTEADVVRVAQSFFDGLGYLTWLEQPYPGQTEKRMDLMAECPWRLNHRYWFVECKGIYEHKDNRCGAERFRARREILKDFDHVLKACAANGEDRWAVVWVAFSPDSKPHENGAGATYFRLPDLVREVRGAHRVEPLGLAVLDLEPLTDYAGLRYCHVIVWGDRRETAVSP